MARSRTRWVRLAPWAGAGLLLAAVPPTCLAGLSPVKIQIRVEKDVETERAGLKGQTRRLSSGHSKRRVSGVDTRAERVVARVEVRNLTPSRFEDARAEVILLADSRPDERKPVYVVQSRESFPLGDLGSLGVETVESSPAEFAVKRSFRGGRQGKTRESGREFAGVAVRVLHDGKTIGESFSPSSREKRFRETLLWPER